MQTRFKQVLTLALAAGAAQAALADITLYERDGFAGRAIAIEGRAGDLRREGFDDRASSAVVRGGPWEVCTESRFDGGCRVLRPGAYPSLAAMGLNDRISSVRELRRRDRVDDARYAPPPEPVRLTLYQGTDFRGRSAPAFGPTESLSHGMDNSVSSVEVSGARWEVCEQSRYRGRCVVLRPGRYPSLAAIGLEDRISSLRPIDWSVRVDEARYVVLPQVAVAPPPPPQPVVVAPPPPLPPQGQWHRRNGERLYQVNVTEVRAIVGPPEQRCWVEQQQVRTESRPNVGGALAGAVIGGILGHQVGGGTGRDIATVGGAVAGGAIGSQVGRDRGGVATRDVQRCESVQSQAAPSMWDVSYDFRGASHKVQMTAPPGATITVNERGEPRL